MWATTPALGDTAPPLRPSSRRDGLVHPSQDATITAEFIPTIPPSRCSRRARKARRRRLREVTLCARVGCVSGTAEKYGNEPTPAEHETQQLRRAGVPRQQTSTQPRVCRTGRLEAVRQHQIARPGVGGSRAVRMQQAGVKTDHSQPRQIGPRSVDGGAVSDSQADSAGSIPVTRSTREKRCSTGESEAISQVAQRSSASENGTRAITACH